MGKTEEPIVITILSAHKKTGGPVSLRKRDLITLFLLATDHPHKLMADKKGVKKCTASRHVSQLYPITGYNCPGGLVGFAFYYDIVKKGNGVIIQGWEELEDGSCRIVVDGG